MDGNGPNRLIELSDDEALALSGGVAYLPALIIGAFGAGFRFGYYELGPKIFG